MKIQALRLTWLAMPLVLALGSVTLLFGILPKLMQDEYVYASQARNLPYSEHAFSNYLFSWVMGATKFCSGDSFYTCAKMINATMFLVGIVFVYLIAIRLLDNVWSIITTSITAVSPLAIQVSFFMPETMYFMAMTITVWVALVASEKGKYWLWSSLGAVLGLATLVKPHALFILPAIVLFAFMVEFRREGSTQKKRLLSPLLATASFFIAKALVGFAFAGPEGLRLFGGYGSPLESAIRVVENQTMNNQETLLAGEPVSGLQAFAFVISSHFFLHLGIMVLIAGVSIALSLRVLKRVFTTTEPVGKAGTFMFLLSLLVVTMLLLVPAFEAYVTATGQDHSDRLILRYYEFLIPLFVIGALLLPKFVESSTRSRYLQATAIAVLSTIVVISSGSAFTGRFVDSSTLAGYSDSYGALVFFSVTTIFATYIWAWRPSVGVYAISFGAIPLFLVTSMVLSQANLIKTSSTEPPYAIAGKVAREVLSGVPSEKIVVIGESRTEVFVTKFWIDKPYTNDLLLVSGSTLTNNSELIKDYEYAVIYEEINVSGDFELLQSGQGFRIFKIIR